MDTYLTETLDDYKLKIESTRTRILNIIDKIKGLSRLQSKSVVLEHLDYLLGVVDDIENNFEDIKEYDEELQPVFFRKDTEKVERSFFLYLKWSLLILKGL